MLLMPLTIDGQHYVLALGVKPLDPSVPGFKENLVEMQRRFRGEASRYSARKLLGMTVLGPRDVKAN